MVNDVVVEQKLKVKENKEFVTRLLSSFMFIPIIALIFVVPYWAFCTICFSVYLVMSAEIIRPGERGNLSTRVVALLWVFLGLVAFAYCRKEFGPLGCGFLICVSSLTDIGGYLIGKAIGGPKMCPKISPKKTWAGLAGAFFLANVGVFILKKFLVQMNTPWIGALWLTQLLIAASVIGDLLESVFKRKIKVKDVGSIVPGHGGLLDRLDSLLCESVFFVLIDLIVR